jgi:hypothetical protein
MSKSRRRDSVPDAESLDHKQRRGLPSCGEYFQQQVGALDIRWLARSMRDVEKGDGQGRMRCISREGRSIKTQAQIMLLSTQ